MRESIHARTRCFHPSGVERRGVTLRLRMSHGSTNAAVRGLRAHDRRDRQLEPLLQLGQAGSMVADCRTPRRVLRRFAAAIVDASVQIPPTMRVFERGWLSSNNVLLYDDEHAATLVDTGYVSHRAQTLALVQSALGGRKLARISTRTCTRTIAAAMHTCSVLPAPASRFRRVTPMPSRTGTRMY